MLEILHLSLKGPMSTILSFSGLLHFAESKRRKELRSDTTQKKINDNMSTNLFFLVVFLPGLLFDVQTFM